MEDAAATQLNRAGADFKWAKINAARKDSTWLRMQTERFNKTIGAERRLTQLNRVGKSPDSPFREELKDNLRVGDIQAARKLMVEWLRTVPQDRQKTAMASLMNSVRMSQPVKVGTGSEALRGAFMDWAKSNLPTESIIRIRQIDSTYRQSAIALGLMKPGEPDDSEIAKALRKYGQ